VAPATDRAGRAAAVRRRLAALAARVPGSAVAIQWEDLERGASVAIHPAQVFRSASLIKIPVAAATLALWERHPELRTAERERWLWKMIAESSNVTVDLLAQHLGGLPAVNRFCREQGWRDTEMNYYFRDWRTRRRQNLTSARDVAAMLRAIDRRALVSPAASETLWSLLKDQTMRQRIPAGLPLDARAEVGNKTGTLLSVVHDAAIIRAPGAHYLLCILIDHPRSEAAGDAYCRQVSRAVWEAMRE
jgi:beta-lactamase class A